MYWAIGDSSTGSYFRLKLKLIQNHYHLCLN
jgi:hypothetical protein